MQPTTQGQPGSATQPGFVMAMQMSQEMQRCLQNCTNCHMTCLQTSAYCLSKGGKHAEPAHIRLLLDCADICRTSADFMLRGSQYHNRVCGTCAEVCSACAKDCEQMGDDQTMQACADMCRRCADSCRQMAGSMPM
jgi:hypothetical protein